LFGSPPYGGSIQQQLYYYDGPACEDTIDSTRGYPSRPLQEGSTKQHPWSSPFILLVDRGNCTFVQKVRHAQHAGAAAVLIADNICQCNHDLCVKDETFSCETTEPIMADDGSGSDITIPTFLLYKEDADTIKQFIIQENSPVRAEMSFPLPTPDSRVEYELWSVPSDPISERFLDQFKEAAVALGKQAFFTPHYYIVDGERAGCDLMGLNECGTMCTNSGRYCALDPDEDLDVGASGADIVNEAARRSCIWNLYGKDDGIGKEWYVKMSSFAFVAR
jgi:hypothetical protein